MDTKQTENTELNETLVETAISLLCGGRSREIVAAELAGEFAAAAIGDTAKQAVEAAIEIIGKTADYNRDYQLGVAISRLDECYRKATAEGELAVAISAQREMNRLLGLHQPLIGKNDEPQQAPVEKDNGRSADIENEELANIVAAIDSYLTPLGELIGEEPADTDADIIRLAAQKIVDLTTAPPKP